MNEASITDLIAGARRGDSGALDQISLVAYDDLHALARARLQSSGGEGLLNTMALVHESYLRFVRTGNLRAEDRPQFLRHAGRVMRSVIVDLARERLAQRRAEGSSHVMLDTDVAESFGGAGEEEILRVDEALEALAKRDERLVQVVEMRYFGGISEAEIAAALEVQVPTVRGDWNRARQAVAEALGVN
jgi:RNA polymerase sigma factor (TIGR02999 family)